MAEFRCSGSDSSLLLVLMLVKCTNPSGASKSAFMIPMLQRSLPSPRSFRKFQLGIRDGRPRWMQFYFATNFCFSKMLTNRSTHG